MDRIAWFESLAASNLGRDMGGVQNVWVRKTYQRTHYPENFGPLHKSFWSALSWIFVQAKQSTDTWGGGKRTVRGGSKTPFWEGCHSWGFPPPSFFYPPMASSDKSRDSWNRRDNIFAPGGCKVLSAFFKFRCSCSCLIASRWKAMTRSGPAERTMDCEYCLTFNYWEIPWDLLFVISKQSCAHKFLGMKTLSRKYARNS